MLVRSNPDPMRERVKKAQMRILRYKANTRFANCHVAKKVAAYHGIESISVSQITKWLNPDLRYKSLLPCEESNNTGWKILVWAESLPTNDNETDMSEVSCDLSGKSIEERIVTERRGKLEAIRSSGVLPSAFDDLLVEYKLASELKLSDTVRLQYLSALAYSYSALFSELAADTAKESGLLEELRTSLLAIIALATGLGDCEQSHYATHVHRVNGYAGDALMAISRLNRSREDLDRGIELLSRALRTPHENRDGHWYQALWTSEFHLKRCNDSSVAMRFGQLAQDDFSNGSDSANLNHLKDEFGDMDLELLEQFLTEHFPALMAWIKN